MVRDSRGGYGNGRAVPRQDTNGYPGGYGNSYPDRGRDPYPGGNGRYGYSAAYPNGLRDGIEKGREDARKRRSFDPLRHDWYRSGDRHYDSRVGSRQEYKDVYRQGFQQGYDRGFREGRYR